MTDTTEKHSLKELNPATVHAVDRAGMIDRVMAMPEHLRQAWQAAAPVQLHIDAKRLRHIVIAGMGGSAIAGDVVRCATYGSLPVPLQVCRTYRVPHELSDGTLFIASSYSGNTEETLTAFSEARRRGAQILCVTSGGRLQEMAQADRLPIFMLPGGFPPRAALAYLVVPLLAIISSCGWFHNAAAEIVAVSALLNERRQNYAPEVEGESNLAKIIAITLHQKIPLIYASADNFEVAACRWKGQFCENSETLAFWNVFPELNHNEIVGWGLRGAFDRNYQVIFLRDRDDHERIQKRMEITRRLIEQSSNSVIEVWSHGDTRLARLFSTIFLGDMVSVYLAVLNGVDPTPVTKIDFLKNELGKMA